MMSLVFRRSASVAASSASKWALVAAASFSSESSLLAGPVAASSSAVEGSPNLILGGGHACGAVRFPGVLCCRKFHSAVRPLEFRATDAVRAEYAIDDAYGHERGASAKGGGDESLEIAKLGIAQDIIGKLANKGITKLFPIQRAVLEPAMQGKDMIGRARTGTGKTLAFGIPILDGIIRFQEKHGRGKYPLAIVLAPTRELARQVEKEFRESSSLDTICVYGGTPAGPQMRTLNYGVDVVVGTPGRIIDLTERGALKLSEIQYVVLDEADQMLAVGFAEDVERILEKLPPRRQSMMFSATMPNWIRSLTRKFLKDPVTIDLVGDSDQKLAEGITLFSIATDNYAKPSVLGPLIKEYCKGGKCIIFTQTKRDADRLHYAMEQSFACEKLHGDVAQNQRERTLTQFRNGNINILIATDVAARGLDIPNVDLVIHYELPNTTELFVHRSGRTGRAGKKGSAILIYTNDQRRAVRGIEQEVGCRFNELPTIATEAGSEDMFAAMNSARFDSPRRGAGFNRSGNSGDFSFGRSRGSGGSSGYGGRGGFGSFGGPPSGSSSGFGNSGFGRPGSFRDTGSGKFGNYGDSSSGRFGSSGDSSSGNFSRFGDSGSRRSGNSSSGLFGSNSGSGQNSFDDFGGGSSKKNADSSWPGRSFMSSS